MTERIQPNEGDLLISEELAGQYSQLVERLGVDTIVKLAELDDERFQLWLEEVRRIVGENEPAPATEPREQARIECECGGSYDRAEALISGRLHILAPPNDGNLNRGDALSWLREDLPGFLRIAMEGYFDPRTLENATNPDVPAMDPRMGFYHLLEDLETIVSTLAEALDQNEDARFSRGDEVPHAQDALSVLATAHDQPPTNDFTPMGSWRRAIDACQRELLWRAGLQAG